MADQKTFGPGGESQYNGNYELLRTEGVALELCKSSPLKAFQKCVSELLALVFGTRGKMIVV
ncbi:hypothetical protein BOTCAL_0964g00040 [Botryotinia calthae]|uniref:Uncharacterized protein n=1 Tax=Botryotinia calthae TaxID=38488 RepID=A0A4Y8CH11_9HELO|nr:hypothetical protein BOTCAL_0964g00040 [Botryotinia calthae]